MKKIISITSLALLMSLTTPTLADQSLSSDDLKKVEYLVDHPDKLKKLEDLPAWKRQRAFEKFGITQEEYDAAIEKQKSTQS